MDFTMTKTVQAGVEVHAVVGDIDALSVAEFNELLTAAVESTCDSPAKAFVLDMNSVSFCSVGGLKALLTAQRSARSAGVHMAVTAGTPVMDRALTLADPARTISSYADRAHALRECASMADHAARG
ncbi:STAS domain-containing protein [Amycolatopsis sp. NPDC059657]|uniref:STAS domain-containing protein n=1 Tax=Amycolatopsis sp. NPDC059657 TaxID=3346899 RepID=UPI00366F37F1